MTTHRLRRMKGEIPSKSLFVASYVPDSTSWIFIADGLHCKTWMNFACGLITAPPHLLRHSDPSTPVCRARSRARVFRIATTSGGVLLAYISLATTLSVSISLSYLIRLLW